MFRLLHLCIALVNYPCHSKKGETDLTALSFYSKDVFPIRYLGPLLPEARDVATIPARQRRNLTVHLCGK